VTLVDAGRYIAVFFLPQTESITVGKLGTFKFSRGFYFYVGSARRNLSARINRHGRKKKTLFWHIDYLSSRAQMVGAIIISDLGRSECSLAVELGRMFALQAGGFGASDCGCGGHLFYTLTLLMGKCPYFLKKLRKKV